MPDATTRLATEEIIWLTTVDAAGQPQSSPVWFLWDGDAVWIASAPGAAKVTNVRGRPAVSLHLEGAAPGELVVSIEGEASLGGVLPEAYDAKYAEGFTRLGTSATAYRREFSAALKVTPKRLRTFLSV